MTTRIGTVRDLIFRSYPTDPHAMIPLTGISPIGGE
jgi:hypothetical protein